MLGMFSLQGKMRSAIGEDRSRDYEAVYRHIADEQAAGRLPVHEDYLGGNELAISVYSRKYYVKDLEGNPLEHSPEDVFRRVASFVAAIESNRPAMNEWGERFYTELHEGRFIPGGRVLAGAGDLFRLKTLANCFVSRIDEDSIDSIYQTAFQCARTYSYGGGIGVDVTPLRPRNAVVHNAADCSTGAVSFMELFSMTTGLIGQSGRRGALMLTIDVKHPDILDFIRVKKDPNWVTRQIVEQCRWSGRFSEPQLKEVEKQVAENTQVRFANISIKACDEFMAAVEEQKRYGESDWLVYRKQGLERKLSAPQDGDVHYSVGIPSRPLENYELAAHLTSLRDLREWTAQHCSGSLDEASLSDPARRDVYGDVLLRARAEDADFEYAIRQSGDFLLYFANKASGETRRLVKAREIWDVFVEGNYRTAEPGLIFWTTMSRFSPSNYVGRPIISTNPCAEVPLEDGGACNLGSLNLSRFVKDPYTDRAAVDWDQLASTTGILVRFLDNVVSWNERLNALGKQRAAASETRRLGLGIMGIADMLYQLGMPYDSEEAIELIGRLSAFITNVAYSTSSGLAAEKGASPVFDARRYLDCPFAQQALTPQTQAELAKNGLRNIAIMSIAPTGTISNIVLSFRAGKKNYIGVSGGVEPVFATHYTRRTESLDNQKFKVFHSTISAWIDMMGKNEEVARADKLEQVLPAFFFRTAHHVDPTRRVRIQSVIQRYIDHSISSTLNLPEDVQPEVISDIYLDAWRMGLKGVTVYRDGSRVPILSLDGKPTEFQRFRQRQFRLRVGDNEQLVAGDEILRLPDGTLSTPYHYLKFNGLSVEHVLQGGLFEEVNA